MIPKPGNDNSDHEIIDRFLLQAVYVNLEENGE